MELKEKIINIKPREKSGSRTQNRFDYQIHWAIAELLELHNDKNNYLIVLEHHDDIIVFDSETEPKKVSFYQIKTNSYDNYWTIKRLLKKDSTDKYTIISKLLLNKVNFPEHTDSINLVSNSNYNFKLTNGNSSLDLNVICFSSLSDEEKSVVIESLAEELSIDKTEFNFEECLFFLASDVNIKDPASSIKGKLLDFFDSLFPGKNLPIITIYKTLCDELRKKARYEPEINSYDDLKRYKGIGRSYIDKVIKCVEENSKDFNSIWLEIVEHLKAENISFNEISKLRKEWTNYIVNQFNYSLTLEKVKAVISKVIDEVSRQNTLTETVELILETFKNVTNNNYSNIYNDYFLKAVILVGLYEK